MYSDNPYETNRLLSQYCEFHFGDDYFGIPNFPARCAGLCIEYMKNRKTSRALDIGCSVGRTTFELARVFSHVSGMDSSARFVETAESIRASGRICYDLPVEGELTISAEHSLVDFGLHGLGERIEFMFADATRLPTDATAYDLIFAGNLIDRLAKPAQFLSSLQTRMCDGGILVLTSPYTWLPEYTPREEWLGGFWRDGTRWTSLDGLKSVLEPHFSLLVEPFDLPFVLRESSRKFQHSLAQVTIWEVRS